MGEVERSRSASWGVGVRGVEHGFKLIYRFPLILTFSPKGEKGPDICIFST